MFTRQRIISVGIMFFHCLKEQSRRQLLAKFEILVALLPRVHIRYTHPEFLKKLVRERLRTYWCYSYVIYVGNVRTKYMTFQPNTTVHSSRVTVLHYPVLNSDLVL
jgi:hypothetical protein